MSVVRARVFVGAFLFALVVVASIAVLALLGLLTVAPSSVAGDGDPVVALESDAASVRGFSAFDKSLPSADADELSRLRSMFAGADGSMATVDFDSARPAQISGSDRNAWIAPASGKVCVFIPDPVDGYGATCSSPADIAAGRGVAVMDAGPNGGPSAIVAALVPDGGDAPEILVGGNATRMRVSSNVAAAVVPSGAKVRVANATIDLSFPEGGPASACAVGAGCAGE